MSIEISRRYAEEMEAQRENIKSRIFGYLEKRKGEYDEIGKAAKMHRVIEIDKNLARLPEVMEAAAKGDTGKLKEFMEKDLEIYKAKLARHEEGLERMQKGLAPIPEAMLERKDEFKEIIAELEDLLANWGLLENK